MGIQGIQLWSVWVGQGAGGKTLCDDVQPRDRAVKAGRTQRRVRRSCRTWRRECLGDKERRIESWAGIGKWTVLLSTVKNSITAAQHSLIGQLVSKADARGEVGQIRGNKTRASIPQDRELPGQCGRERGVLSGGNDQGLRSEIK